jgi:MATE family multidrug resistance protein
VGVFLLRRQIGSALANYDRGRLLERGALMLLFTANFNIFVRTLCLLFAFSYFTALGAKQGEIILAANAILMHLQSIMAAGLDGFAHAVEAMAGSIYGAGRRRLFRRAVAFTGFWGLAVALLAGAVYYLCGAAIVGLFTGIAEVYDTALTYLPWIVISPLVSVWSFQLDGIFIGTGHTREMRNAMIASLLGYLAFLEWSVPAFGNHGLFAGLLVFMLVRAATLGFYFPGIEAAMTARREALT